MPLKFIENYSKHFWECIFGSWFCYPNLILKCHDKCNTKIFQGYYKKYNCSSIVKFKPYITQWKSFIWTSKCYKLKSVLLYSTTTIEKKNQTHGQQHLDLKIRIDL